MLGYSKVSLNTSSTKNGNQTYMSSYKEEDGNILYIGPLNPFNLATHMKARKSATKVDIRA